MELPHNHVEFAEGQPVERRDVHGVWLLAEQDCNLAWKALLDTSFGVELKPVYVDDPPDDMGVRAMKFLLDGSGAHLCADATSVHVTSEVVDAAVHATCCVPDSTRRLKTWLGLRYDRPAVSERYVTLARSLADRIKAKRRRSAGEPVRDVLATFRTKADGGAEYTLVAVLPHRTATPAMIETTREWLSEAALEVPIALGHPMKIDAYPDDRISLAYVEESFSLDISSVSWPRNKPGPIGEV